MGGSRANVMPSVDFTGKWWPSIKKEASKPGKHASTREK